MSISFTPQTKLLFIGDSITDCQRNEDVNHVGLGYVQRIRDYLLAADPMRAPYVMNMGISGHRVTDLASRWQNDVIAHRPDVLSVMIGINDVWHGLDGRKQGVPVETFEATYDQLIAQTRELLPACKIVVCEPTVIMAPAHKDGNAYLSPYVKVVRKIGERYYADAIIPLHSAFVSAIKMRPDIAWTTDGVHPTTTGHMLIARTWLETTRNL
jgi:acyl-CoA thioesterase-1